MVRQRLVRSEQDQMIAGICSGIADYLQISSTWVRLAFLLLIPASGVGLFLYLILLVIMPTTNQLEMPAKTFAEENLSHLGETVMESVQKISQQSADGLNAGILLILLGVLFLLMNFGWLNSYLIWPLMLISAGILVILRHRR